MTPEGLTKRFGDVEITFDRDCDDVVSAALAMLAYGISGLPSNECEDRLQGIEDGALREAISRFLATRSQPYRHAPH